MATENYSTNWALRSPGHVKANHHFLFQGVVVNISGSRPVVHVHRECNVTYKSEAANEEFCFRVTGPAVRQVLERLAGHRLKGKLWDGT